MSNVVLLGDSIFDNAAYVGGGPDVVTQLRPLLPQGWQATLRAVDGGVTGSVAAQLRQLPPDASHLVVSVGGNDALRHSGVPDEGARSVAGAVNALGEVREQFQRDYRAMLDAVTARRLPRLETTIEPESTACPCCAGALVQAAAKPRVWWTAAWRPPRWSPRSWWRSSPGICRCIGRRRCLPAKASCWT